MKNLFSSADLQLNATHKVANVILKYVICECDTLTVHRPKAFNFNRTTLKVLKHKSLEKQHQCKLLVSEI